jgi:hypothetical protein
MSYHCEACRTPLPPKGRGRRRLFCSDRYKAQGHRFRNAGTISRISQKTAPAAKFAECTLRKPAKNIDISMGEKGTPIGPEERRQLIRRAYELEFAARWPITNVRASA